VIESIPIDPPMLSLTVTLNDSPLKGKDGDKLTVAQIRERVERESQDDVSLKIEPELTKSEFVTMHGRGDLHLGVLIEKMRREGFELAVTPPQVIMKEDPDRAGVMLEPYEEVTIDTDLQYVSGIIDKLNDRKGVLLDIQEQKDGRQLLTLKVPTRGLLGYRNSLTTETKGTA
jgi:GTP-binding protein